MEKMPSLQEVPKGRGRSETRWNAMEKNVIYFDFRHGAISSFDRCFYVNPFKKTKTIVTKQDYIRRYARHLKKIISQNLQTYKLRGRERLNENKLLSINIVKKISEILGKIIHQLELLSMIYILLNLQKQYIYHVVVI